MFQVLCQVLRNTTKLYFRHFSLCPSPRKFMQLPWTCTGVLSFLSSLYEVGVITTYPHINKEWGNRFREVQWLAKGAQLSARRSMHLKPPSFAPDCTRAHGGDLGVRGSPSLRAPEVTPHPRPLPAAQPRPPRPVTRLRQDCFLRGCVVKAGGGNWGGVAVLREKETSAASFLDPFSLRLRRAAAWVPRRGPWSFSTMCCPPTPGWASRWRGAWESEDGGKSERRTLDPWSRAILALLKGSYDIQIESHGWRSLCVSKGSRLSSYISKQWYPKVVRKRGNSKESRRKSWRPHFLALRCQFGGCGDGM